MKFLILFACLAAASASHILGHGVYHGSIHLPVINGEGVPVDTASVQHARAAHLSHRANVHARNGDHLGWGVHGGAGVVVGHAGILADDGILTHTPVVGHGVLGHGLLGHAGVHGLWRKRRSLVHGGLLGLGHGGLLVGGHSGLLIDGGLGGHGGHSGLLIDGGLGGHGGHYVGPIHLPIINHEGVPVDTASVQHARAAHLSHRAHVQARNGDHLGLGHGGWLGGHGIIVGHH